MGQCNSAGRTFKERFQTNQVECLLDPSLD
jgi:hypothetical protein